MTPATPALPPPGVMPPAPLIDMPAAPLLLSDPAGLKVPELPFTLGCESSVPPPTQAAAKIDAVTKIAVRTPKDSRRLRRVALRKPLDCVAISSPLRQTQLRD